METKDITAAIHYAEEARDALIDFVETVGGRYGKSWVEVETAFSSMEDAVETFMSGMRALFNKYAKLEAATK
jgi:hypothetical protein